MRFTQYDYIQDLDNREKFSALIEAIDNLKQTFKKEYRRKKPTYRSIIGYELTKVISGLLRKLRDGRRITLERETSLLKNIVLKWHLSQMPNING